MKRIWLQGNFDLTGRDVRLHEFPFGFAVTDNKLTRWSIVVVYSCTEQSGPRSVRWSITYVHAQDGVSTVTGVGNFAESQKQIQELVNHQLSRYEMTKEEVAREAVGLGN